jgi:hypothetical protein
MIRQEPVELIAALSPVKSLLTPSAIVRSPSRNQETTHNEKLIPPTQIKIKIYNHLTLKI